VEPTGLSGAVASEVEPVVEASPAGGGPEPPSGSRRTVRSLGDFRSRITFEEKGNRLSKDAAEQVGGAQGGAFCERTLCVHAIR
jgi:hypothetical protein